MNPPVATHPGTVATDVAWQPGSSRLRRRDAEPRAVAAAGARSATNRKRLVGAGLGAAVAIVAAAILLAGIHLAALWGRGRSEARPRSGLGCGSCGVVVRGRCVLHGDRVNDVEHLLIRAARAAAEHRRTVGERPVAPSTPPEQIRAAFAVPLPDGPTDPDDVLTKLLAAAEGAITGTAGPRYFGFVIGGALPAASAADVLTTGWDQCGIQRGSLARGRCGRTCCGRLGRRSCSACRPSRRWASSPAPRPATRSASRSAGTRSSPKAGWDVARDGLSGRPRSVWSPARSATPPSTGRAAARDGDRQHRTRSRADDNGAIEVDHLERSWPATRGAAHDRVPSGRQREHRRVR